VHRGGLEGGDRIVSLMKLKFQERRPGDQSDEAAIAACQLGSVVRAPGDDFYQLGDEPITCARFKIPARRAQRDVFRAKAKEQMLADFKIAADFRAAAIETDLVRCLAWVIVFLSNYAVHMLTREQGAALK
jgi:hypothetical protein